MHIRSSKLFLIMVFFYCHNISAETNSVNNYSSNSMRNYESSNKLKDDVCKDFSYKFKTQSDLDKFNENCTIIRGDLIIGGLKGKGIYDVGNLSKISRVNRDVKILGTNLLTNVDGFKSLGFIGGDLELKGNKYLYQLDGLKSLRTLEGSLSFIDNYDLSFTSGLTNLHAIHGDLHIAGNKKLWTMSGLYNVTEVGGDIRIENNPALLTLNGLYNVNSIGGGLYIESNDSLPDLEGLNFEQLGKLKDDAALKITSNENLGDCSSICSLLVNDSNLNRIDIFANKGQCLNEEKVNIACGIEIDCPPGDYIFKKQSQIDNFYDENRCTRIQGELHVGSTYSLDELSDIENLEGLKRITYVGGNLHINNAYVLKNLDPLSGITYVGGEVNISYNQAITNLNGLSNIQSIGQGLILVYNRDLIDVSGLSKIRELHQILAVVENPSLVSLKGINVDELLEPLSYESLDIFGNPNLKDCKAICLLSKQSNITNTLSIQRNAGTCEDRVKVKFACE